MSAYKVVLLRHGQSLWNKENRFTGWKDVDLTDEGRREAQSAAALLKSEGFQFDVAHTSVLKRAIRTLWICLDNLDQMWIPVKRSWRLNERHYGGLTGLNKSETAEKFGEEQVFVWRRSYDTPPPPLDAEDANHPAKDAKYRNIDSSLLPASEALKHCKDRVMPYWEEQIVPDIRAGKTVIVAAHGNSLRAVVKHLDNISDEEISKLNIPTGIPLIYELDENLKAIRHYYLGDPEAAANAAKAVANQAK